MTCNATIKWVEYLWRQGVKLSDIRISTPSVSLRKLCSSFSKIGKDAACQTDIPQTTTEELFTELCYELNMSTTDFDIIPSEIIRDLHNWCSSILYQATCQLPTKHPEKYYSVKHLQCNGTSHETKRSFQPDDRQKEQQQTLKAFNKKLDSLHTHLERAKQFYATQDRRSAYHLLMQRNLSFNKDSVYETTNSPASITIRISDRRHLRWNAQDASPSEHLKDLILLSSVITDTDKKYTQWLIQQIMLNTYTSMASILKLFIVHIFTFALLLNTKTYSLKRDLLPKMASNCD